VGGASLNGFLRWLGTAPEAAWLKRSAGSKGSILTPLRVRSNGRTQPQFPVLFESYLDELTGDTPEAQPAWDPGAEALAILDREARQRGPSDPPRRQRDGAWAVRWRFPAPSAGQDSPEWQEAVWSGLRAAGGWGAWCGLAGRERDFTRRRVAAEVQQKMRRSG
jgi:hypothetical protein